MKNNYLSSKANTHIHTEENTSSGNISLIQKGKELKQEKTFVEQEANPSQMKQKHSNKVENNINKPKKSLEQEAIALKQKIKNRKQND